MDDDFLNHISDAVPTVVVGALTLSFSLSVAKCVEYAFRRGFGEMDTMLKHITYVFVCCTILLVVTALASGTK